MANISVLIIDDELPVLNAVSAVLKRENIDAFCAQSCMEGFDLLKKHNFDIILLDIMMPEQDGFSFLEELRKFNILTPVILLSGREEDASQVQGLGLGADDYMTKPFNKAILVSKIRAIVRRTQQYAPSASASFSPILTRGSFTLHLDSQLVQKDGQDISLSSKEFALLYFFLENEGKVLTKQEIFSKVWKSDVPDDNMILVYIKRLRDKIEPESSKPVHLTTVWGKGYRFFP